MSGYDPEALLPVAQAQGIHRPPGHAGELTVESLALHALGARLACSPSTWCPASTCRVSTTRRWTAAPCAAPISKSAAETTLELAGARLCPGSGSKKSVGAGQCVRIMTGADHAGRPRHRLLPQEFTRLEGKAVSASPPASVRRPSDNSSFWRAGDIARRRRSDARPRSLQRPATISALLHRPSLGLAEGAAMRRRRPGRLLLGRKLRAALRSAGRSTPAPLICDCNPLHHLCAGHAAAASGVGVIDTSARRSAVAASSSGAAFASRRHVSPMRSSPSGRVSVHGRSRPHQLHVVASPLSGEVLFLAHRRCRWGWLIASGRIAWPGGSLPCCSGCPGDPVAVMVTFYALRSATPSLLLAAPPRHRS